MYSIVLMAALASAGDTPNWGHGCGGGCWGYGHGCYGSYGHGCYGGYGYGCYGCWGGYGYGCCGGYGYGCCGGYGCYGGCCGGGYYSPYHVTPNVVPAKPAELAPPPKEKEGAAAANQAKLLVELPADAKLFIDDQPMKTPAARRTFNTPALQPGQTYYYIVRAEVVIDGKTHTETKQVLVRAGQTAEAKFTELLAKVEASKAPAAVAGAQ